MNIKVYKADNGDVFYYHGHLTEDKIKEAESVAMKKYINDEYTKVVATGDEIISYYDGEEFLGNSGIHVKNKYNEFQDHTYLFPAHTKTEKLFDNITEILKGF